MARQVLTGSSCLSMRPTEVILVLLNYQVTDSFNNHCTFGLLTITLCNARSASSMTLKGQKGWARQETTGLPLTYELVVTTCTSNLIGSSGNGYNFLFFFFFSWLTMGERFYLLGSLSRGAPSKS